MRNKITKKKKYKNYKKSRMTKNKKYIKRNSKKYTKKGRKNKKGGLNVIEEEKFTKKNTRWKQNKSKYDSLKKSSCDNVSNYSELITRLESNFVKKNNLKIFNNTYTIFPYCNEELKGPASLDKVNAPFTSSEALYALHKVFESNFSSISPANIDGNYTSIDKLSNLIGVSSPENDPNMFIKAINAFNKNSFIVSHSGFMTKLYDYITRKKLVDESDIYGDIYTKEYHNEPSIEDTLMEKGIYIYGGGIMKKIGLQKERDYGVFDNLDILQLIFDINGELLYMLVRRYSKNYKLDNELELDKSAYGSLKSVFIMRHCLGCHNVTPGITTKIGQAIGQATTGKNFGYLDWSLCFEDTVDEMMVVGKDLHNLLEKYGGFKNYTFGSSVIFRAILTSILMYNVINNIVDTPIQEDETIILGLTTPKDPESPN
tara:strand:+ start:12368 stop:13654 length:1287 start_codon:yes stop_codon:yes gene_type:complete